MSSISPPHRERRLFASLLKSGKTSPVFELRNNFRLSIVVFTLLSLLRPAQSSAALGAACVDVFVENSAAEKSQVVYEKFSPGAKDYFEADRFAQEILALPKVDKLSWIRAIGDVYQSVPKKNPSPTAPRLIGGRRLLDRALTLLLREDKLFNIEAQKGLPVRRIYRDFLAGRASLFHTANLADEIEAIIQFLQTQLQTLNIPGKERLRISLVGSFFNGRANPHGSDIDISVNDPRLAREVAEWQSQLNRILGRDRLGPEIELEMHGYPVPFFGRHNPVAIEVTTENVWILVFPPAGSGAGDSLIAMPPARYLLAGKPLSQMAEQRHF